MKEAKKLPSRGPTTENRLDGIVHAEVETTVDHGYQERKDRNHGRDRQYHQRPRSFAVNIDETVELTIPAALGGRLGIVGQTSTGDNR